MSNLFEDFRSQLSETNATLDGFTDFKKVELNVNKIAIKLNQLNYLIGKEDLLLHIKSVFIENPKAFEVLDVLIAARKNKNAKTFNREGKVVSLDSYFHTPEKIYEFMEDTGLKEVFQNKNITNLVDYVFGVEVGLDSNARKNRGGNNMTKAVVAQFDSADIAYRTEVNSTEFGDIETLGQDTKRFDFVIKTKQKTYLIEINYYNGGGSKLNEVARSFSEIAPKINCYPNYEFVWITDGQGWQAAKSKLKEAFSIIPSVYNLNSLNKFIEKVKKELL